MLDLAVLAPVVLLLLMLVLGRLERWLHASLPPPSPDRRRWRRATRSVTAPSSVAVRAGRRTLARRAGARSRRRAARAAASGGARAAAPGGPVAVPRAGRRHLLGGRLRHGDG